MLGHFPDTFLREVKFMSYYIHFNHRTYDIMFKSCNILLKNMPRIPFQTDVKTIDPFTIRFLANDASRFDEMIEELQKGATLTSPTPYFTKSSRVHYRVNGPTNSNHFRPITF